MGSDGRPAVLLGEGVIVVGANLDRVRQSTLELVGSICP
jgi:hypothetical protein